MSGDSPIGAFLNGQTRARRGDLLMAALGAAGATAAATWLLGLSGWFMAGAALAGAGGPAVLQAFNYLLPSTALRGLAIIRTGGRYGERLWGHRAALKALAALRPALFAGLAAAPPAEALSLSSGEAAARLVQDVNALETAFVRRAAPWAALAGAGAAGGVIALASVWAAGGFLAGLGLQLIVGDRLLRRLTADPGRNALRAGGRLKDGLAAYLPAAAELRSFDLTAKAAGALMAHDGALGAARLKGHDGQALATAVRAGLAALTLAAIASLCLHAPMPLVALALLAALAGMEGIGGLLQGSADRSAYDEAIIRLDGMLTAAPSPGPAPPRRATLRLDGQDLPTGTCLGITGPSGCGKTSLLEALVGLKPAPPGRLVIDNRPLDSEPLGWARSLFALAPQDARLTTGTIAEALRLADPDADDAALWDALADAQLAERVRAAPEGLETWIGDGGEILSGGERRRLVLARAYLRPAPWLLLDEPTEGLDRDTEARVIAALAARLARTGQGAIIVSHRPAPLGICESVVRLGG
jgi:ATP-binding cassette subfamily C protein CydC